MQLFNIVHIKVLLELLPLAYIACPYDQIIHVEDFHDFTRLFDVYEMICLAPTKTLVNIEKINTVAPRP